MAIDRRKRGEIGRVLAAHRWRRTRLELKATVMSLKKSWRKRIEVLWLWLQDATLFAVMLGAEDYGNKWGLRLALFDASVFLGVARHGSMRPFVGIQAGRFIWSREFFAKKLT